MYSSEQSGVLYSIQFSKVNRNQNSKLMSEFQTFKTQTIVFKKRETVSENHSKFQNHPSIQRKMNTHHPFDHHSVANIQQGYTTKKSKGRTLSFFFFSCIMFHAACRGTIGASRRLATVSLSRSRRVVVVRRCLTTSTKQEAATTTPATTLTGGGSEMAKKTGWWYSAELWGGLGALAGWGMSGAAIYDASLQGPEVISLTMTPVLIVYSSLFARWAWVVKPQNLLLCGCHVTNVLAQGNQLRRALEHKMQNGQEKEVQDMCTKATIGGAVLTGSVLVGPMMRSTISNMNLGVVSKVAAADAGPFTVHFVSRFYSLYCVS
jgi:mitochondrial pyruvate carrier 1